MPKKTRSLISFLPLTLFVGPALVRGLMLPFYSNTNRQLNAAVLRNDTAGVKAALKAGADPNKELQGWSFTDCGQPILALFEGDFHQHMRDTPLLLTMDSLVKRGAEATTPHNSDIPLENLDTVKALVEAGAEVNARGFIGQTALYEATEWGYTDTALYLLNHGANPNIADSGGGTPCSNAATNGNIRLLKELLKNGADPNMTDCLGDSALHMAVFTSRGARQVETVRLLLLYGANPRLKDRDGLTPLGFAKKWDDKDSIALFEKMKL